MLDHLQLPAWLTRVAGGSFHPPGVLSAGVPRMICILSKARKAWSRRVGFLFGRGYDLYSMRKTHTVTEIENCRLREENVALRRVLMAGGR